MALINDCWCFANNFVFIKKFLALCYLYLPTDDI